MDDVRSQKATDQDLLFFSFDTIVSLYSTDEGVVSGWI